MNEPVEPYALDCLKYSSLFGQAQASDPGWSILDLLTIHESICLNPNSTAVRSTFQFSENWSSVPKAWPFDSDLLGWARNVHNVRQRIVAIVKQLIEDAARL